MYTSSGRKIRIDLTDYDFTMDLKNRLLLSKLNSFEVQVLQEIVYNSLKFPLTELAALCDASHEEVEKALDQLLPLGLFEIEEGVINVDKEIRRYFEVQVERFSEDFKPDLEFFQELLSQVPIHILSVWYSLPKTSDNLFESIIDRHLLTPKTYERFLYELYFDEARATEIIDDLYSSPDFSLDVASMQQKYGLSDDALETIIISLEFNKVCCLSYVNEEGYWRRVLTPYAEWRDYLLFLQKTIAKPIDDGERIHRQHPNDFGFVEDIDLILREMTLKSSLSVTPVSEGYSFSASIPDAILGCSATAPFCSNYEVRLIEKLITLRLAVLEDGRLTPSENASIWLEKPIQEKAMALYFNTINHYRKKDTEELFTDRDIREIEKGLKRVLHGKWVYADDFIEGLTASIGDSEEVTLRKKGRRWGYVIPKYQEKEKLFILEVLRHHLFESGMIAIGMHEGKLCFAATPFGILSLGE